MTRKHDLPPSWNGHVVVWRGWEATPTVGVFVCPPPRQEAVCTGCASRKPQDMNVGYVAERPDSTLADVQYDEAAQARLPQRIRHKYERKHPVFARLFAWRCPDCRLDTVHDMETDEWWTLDASDYGDDGSHDPNTLQGALF